MLDPKLIRNDLEAVALNLRIKNFELDVSAIANLESRRKEVQVKTEALQADRNSRSKAIGQAKAKGEDIDPYLAEVAALGDELDKQKAALDDIQSELNDIMMAIPNLSDDSVPEGKSEDDNVLVRTWGDPTEFAFDAKDHVDLAAPGGLMDFEAAEQGA